MSVKISDGSGAATEPARLLAAQLNDEDWQVRRDARLALQDLGLEATPYIIPVLRSPHESGRWEAAKTLVNIADPVAAPALVESLEDDSFEIQWLAAEALIAIGEDAVLPLLKALISHPESPSLRSGAHHILHDLERRQNLPRPVLDVLDNIRSLGMNEYLMILSRQAVKYLTRDTPQPDETDAKHRGNDEN